VPFGIATGEPASAVVLVLDLDDDLRAGRLRAPVDLVRVRYDDVGALGASAERCRLRLRAAKPPDLLRGQVLKAGATAARGRTQCSVTPLRA
jgi:hypothetical protein